MNKLKRGTQIIYVPSHAKGDTNHSDCESGFVVSLFEDGEVAFCRYWSRQVAGRLRTKLNNESTRVSNLVICNRVPQSWVENALEKWCGVIK